MRSRRRPAGNEPQFVLAALGMHAAIRSSQPLRCGLQAVAFPALADARIKAKARAAVKVKRWAVGHTEAIRASSAAWEQTRSVTDSVASLHRQGVEMSTGLQS